MKVTEDSKAATEEEIVKEMAPKIKEVVSVINEAFQKYQEKNNGVSPIAIMSAMSFCMIEISTECYKQMSFDEAMDLLKFSDNCLGNAHKEMRKRFADHYSDEIEKKIEGLDMSKIKSAMKDLVDQFKDKK